MSKRACLLATENAPSFVRESRTFIGKLERDFRRAIDLSKVRGPNLRCLNGEMKKRVCTNNGNLKIIS